MQKKAIDPDHLPYCLRAEDIAQLLGISRSMAYELMHRSDFPLIELGGRCLTTRSQDFIRWLDERCNVTFEEG